MNETPIEPLVTGAKRATVHFVKAAIEVASGLGALVAGVSRTVRPDHVDTDDDGGPQHVTVE